MEKISKLVLSLFLCSLCSPMIASAAALSFAPSVFAPNVGSTFVVNVMVSTPDKAMNAASGVISYDPESLELISLSKTGSIMSIWAEEPKIGLTPGQVSFEGIALSPGYTGATGKVFSLTFKAIKAGATKLTFPSGSVLASDGTGGNILSSLQPLALVLGGEREVFVERKAVSVVQKEKNSSLPTNGKGMKINSDTHPDQDAWYNDDSPVFSWSLPEEALEVKTLISTYASRNPTVPYIPPISEKRADKLVDGTHYFSLQARTKSGWTSVSRYQVNIDTAVPKPFRIKIINEDRDKKTPPYIAFETSDSLSGMSHYEVRVDDGKPMRTSAHDIKDPFAIPNQKPGAHTITVQAFDKAGNMSTSQMDFAIEAIPAPKIISAPSIVLGDEGGEIKGVAEPYDVVTIRYANGTTVVHEERVPVGAEGNFTLPTTKKLSHGAYILSAYAINQSGAESYETGPMIITFKPFYASSTFVLYVLLIFIVVIAVMAAIGMWYYTRRHSERVARVALLRIRYAEQETEKAFDILREEIVDRVALLKAKKPKRKYTNEEMKFLEMLESYLGEAKDVIVSDVRKVLEK